MHKTEKNCRPRQQFLFKHPRFDKLCRIFCQNCIESGIFSAVADSELASQIQAENTKQGFGIQCNSVKIDINIKITFRAAFTNSFAASTLFNTIFFSFI